MVEAAVTSTDAPANNLGGVSSNQRIVELRVELPNFERTVDDRGNEVVFYMVHVALGRRKWRLEKRFNQFYELDVPLRQNYANLPKLPAKTYFKLKTHEQIEARRQQLHAYLQEIVNRPDMRTNSAFRTFLEIDEQLPESVTYQPVKVAELTDLALGAREFCYVESRGLLFVAMSEMNIGSRLDSYITNFTMPWEKKKKEKNASNNDQVYSTVGAVACYKMKLTKNAEGQVDSWSFQNLWAKSFALQTGSMCWDDTLKILYIGFDQGRLVRIQLLGDNPMQHRELPELGIHTLRITGISSLGEDNTFYTVSDDGTFKLTDNKTGMPLAEVRPSQGALKQLVPFQHRNCLGISDAKGNLHLYTKTNPPPESIVSIQVESQSEIKGLAISSAENHAVAGSQDGTINVFDLQAAGKERLIKPLVALQGKKNVRCLQWRERPRREIIAGHQDGLVTVWDYKQQSPIFVLQAHTQAITSMQWDEDKQILMTCAKDKSFKIWQFPLIWVDEQNVDLQRAPNAAKLRSMANAGGAAKASGQSRANHNVDSESDDDGLGRIKTKSKKNALPAGLGSTLNPLGAAQAQQPAQTSPAQAQPAQQYYEGQEANYYEEEAKQEKAAQSQVQQVSANFGAKQQESESDDSDDLGGWND